MPTQSRNYQLDIIRIIACLMVITMHAPQPGLGLPGWFCVANSMITSPCIGLFFMVSGALLLPVKLSYKDFVKKRLTKVIWPTLVFTAFYMIVRYITIANKGGQVEYLDVIISILSIPFSPQGTGIIWFMYPLIGMYFLAPVITPFFEKCSKREFQFVLLLWLMSLTLPTLSNYLMVYTNETSIFYSFNGYVGYFLLGYYLKRFPMHINFWVLPFLIIIPFIISYLSHENYCNIDTWYLSVFCVMQCLAWYQFILQFVKTNKWSAKSKLVVEIISNCCFGIYLMHPFIMRTILWNVNCMMDFPYIRNLLVILLTFVISLITTYCISKTNFGQYVVGWKNRLQSLVD